MMWKNISYTLASRKRYIGFKLISLSLLLVLGTSSKHSKKFQLIKCKYFMVISYNILKSNIIIWISLCHIFAEYYLIHTPIPLHSGKLQLVNVLQEQSYAEHYNNPTERWLNYCEQSQMKQKWWHNHQEMQSIPSQCCNQVWNSAESGEAQINHFLQVLVLLQTDPLLKDLL